MLVTECVCCVVSGCSWCLYDPFFVSKLVFFDFRYRVLNSENCHSEGAFWSYSHKRIVFIIPTFHFQIFFLHNFHLLSLLCRISHIAYLMSHYLDNFLLRFLRVLLYCRWNSIPSLNMHLKKMKFMLQSETFEIEFPIVFVWVRECR